MAGRFPIQGPGPSLRFRIWAGFPGPGRLDLQRRQSGGEVAAEPGTPGAPRPRQVDAAHRRRGLFEIPLAQPEISPVLGQDGRPPLAAGQHHG